MSVKRPALLIAKLAFCVVSTLMIWAHPTPIANGSSSFIPCPPGCKPAGALHCICP
jgi:hypothetical protein